MGADRTPAKAAAAAGLVAHQLVNHPGRDPDVFARHQGLAGLIVAEFNPDQGAEDSSTADALVRGLVGALTG